MGSCRFVLGQCYLANGEGQKVRISLYKQWFATCARSTVCSLLKGMDTAQIENDKNCCVFTKYPVID